MVLDTPLTLGPEDTVVDALHLLPKRAHGALVVVDEQQRPLGVVAEADCRGVDRFTQLHRVMSRDPLTLEASAVESAQAACAPAFDPLHAARRKFAPVVRDGRLTGVLTRTGALRSTIYTAGPGLRPAGCGSVSRSGSTATSRRRRRACSRRGADVLVVDTAHGHQERMLEALRIVRGLDPQVPVVAGNVVTAAGVRDLVAAGADIVKVGVGPGAMCTTRMMTAVGRPQFSAVLECAAAARELGPARVGGRRRPPPPRRRPRPRRRRQPGDDRVLVRRDLREPGRPAARRAGAGVQGELRHGVVAGGRGADAPETARSSGPARACSRRASRRRGCTSTRGAPGSRTCSTRSRPASAAPAPTSAPRRWPSSPSAPSSGVQSRAGFEEGRPLPGGW